MKIVTNLLGLGLSLFFLIAIPVQFENKEVNNEDFFFYEFRSGNTLLKHSLNGVQSFNFYALDTFVIDGVNEAKQVRYLQTYFLYAIIEQAFNDIPASVTLAQGLLETGSNLSPLGNNHFGIKTTGEKYFLWTDDKENERFASYNSARQSFRDHSRLLTGDRYKECLLYRKVLKKYVNCIHSKGYATDPKYSSKLLSLIEKYKLWQFDRALVAEE